MNKEKTPGMAMEESAMKPHSLSSETLRKWIQRMTLQRLLKRAQGQV